ncbi:transmembrane protein 165 [Trichuris trichiura]|uniref:GDT1 family protein n=1 Tax=Trichuris trichiura TaxID=36087 RepID=A0A077ZIU3_TRITR|nr:transmembrane protein 165 [Trichuris trichiura]
MVIVSELGDKTFFIAATLSMKYSRTVVFAGSITALFVMTVLSAFFGYAVQVIPRIYVVYFSALLFFLFGVKMLHSAYHMTDMAAAEELEEAQAEIQKRETKSSSSRSSPADLESGSVSYREGIRRFALLRFIGTVFFEAFILTFFAEWGDRSQITTIVLAARESVSGVISGGILGHCLCTGLAVVGGRLVSQRISVKNVTYIGGVVFVVFAISSLLLDKEVSGLVLVQ